MNRLQGLDRTGNRRFAPILVHPDRVEKHILEDEKEARDYIIDYIADRILIMKNGELIQEGKTGRRILPIKYRCVFWYI